MLIDLHVHTIATPGHATWEPDALMRYAQKHGVDVVSVTDHNIVAQVPADGLRPRPAVECAAFLQQGGILYIKSVELALRASCCGEGDTAS